MVEWRSRVRGLREEALTVAAAIAVGAILYLFLNVDEDGRDRLSALVNAAAVLAAVVALYLTYRSVRLSREALEEARLTRLAGEQPRIVVYPVNVDSRRIDLIVENVGRSPAYDVEVTTAERDSAGAVVPQITWTSLRSREIVRTGTYLPAGGSIRRLLMEGQPMYARRELGFSIVMVTCKWRWPEANADYEVDIPVDPSILLHA
jgi:hypothetical protein